MRIFKDKVQRLEDKGDIKKLCELATDSKSKYKEASISALKRLGGKGAVPLLIEQFKETKDVTHIIHAIGGIGPEAKDALSIISGAFIRYLESKVKSYWSSFHSMDFNTTVDTLVKIGGVDAITSLVEVYERGILSEEQIPVMEAAIADTYGLIESGDKKREALNALLEIMLREKASTSSVSSILDRVTKAQGKSQEISCAKTVIKVMEGNCQKEDIEYLAGMIDEKSSVYVKELVSEKLILSGISSKTLELIESKNLTDDLKYAELTSMSKFKGDKQQVLQIKKILDKRVLEYSGWLSADLILNNREMISKLSKSEKKEFFNKDTFEEIKKLLNYSSNDIFLIFSINKVKMFEIMELLVEALDKDVYEFILNRMKSDGHFRGSSKYIEYIKGFALEHYHRKKNEIREYYKSHLGEIDSLLEKYAAVAKKIYECGDLDNTYKSSDTAKANYLLAEFLLGDAGLGKKDVEAVCSLVNKENDFNEWWDNTYLATLLIKLVKTCSEASKGVQYQKLAANVLISTGETSKWTDLFMDSDDRVRMKKEVEERVLKHLVENIEIEVINELYDNVFKSSTGLDKRPQMIKLIKAVYEQGKDKNENINSDKFQKLYSLIEVINGVENKTIIYNLEHALFSLNRNQHSMIGIIINAIGVYMEQDKALEILCNFYRSSGYFIEYAKKADKISELKYNASNVASDKKVQLDSLLTSYVPNIITFERVLAQAVSKVAKSARVPQCANDILEDVIERIENIKTGVIACIAKWEATPCDDCRSDCSCDEACYSDCFRDG